MHYHPVSIPQPTSIRPGPYTVAAATASLLEKFPVPFTNAAIVNPFAKPSANGKPALKVVFPSAPGSVAEIGTVTGTFAPERYTIEFALSLTGPSTANTSCIFFGSGVVTTVSGAKVVRLIPDSG